MTTIMMNLFLQSQSMSCFFRGEFGKCKSNFSPLPSICGLHHLLRELPNSSAANQDRSVNGKFSKFLRVGRCGIFHESVTKNGEHTSKTLESVESRDLGALVG